MRVNPNASNFLELEKAKGVIRIDKPAENRRQQFLLQSYDKNLKPPNEKRKNVKSKAYNQPRRAL